MCTSCGFLLSEVEEYSVHSSGSFGNIPEVLTWNRFDEWGEPAASYR